MHIKKTNIKCVSTLTIAHLLDAFSATLFLMFRLHFSCFYYKYRDNI